MVGIVSALSLLVAGASHSSDPCRAALPRGPAVPAPIVLSTDCGWFRLETGGAVNRLPIDWLAKQNQEWRRRHGDRQTVRRTRSGRYLVVRSGRIIWRSAGTYRNDSMGIAFGPGAFAFGSYRRGVFLTDLENRERLVQAGRGFSPLAFTSRGELLAAGRSTVSVISPEGIAVRRYRYRQSTGYAFDERTKTLYFVTPGGMLSEARGSALRRVGQTSARGWIGLLGRRLLTFTGQHHFAVLRRGDGSFVASAGWRGASRELDAGPSVTDDGRLFAFRVSTARPGVRRSAAVVYLLRAGERRARALYRHRMGQAGCGSGAGLAWHGVALLYRSTDSSGVAEVSVLSPSGNRMWLTPLLRGLPRIAPSTPGNASWAGEFLA